MSDEHVCKPVIVSQELGEAVCFECGSYYTYFAKYDPETLEECRQVLGAKPMDLVTLPSSVLFPVLDAMRLAYVYALKDSHPEELGDDFKKYKWDGYEVDFALESSAAYRGLLDAMTAYSETTRGV